MRRRAGGPAAEHEGEGDQQESRESRGGHQECVQPVAAGGDQAHPEQLGLHVHEDLAQEQHDDGRRARIA